MSDVWEHSDRVVCTHPGWVTLRGWGAVGGSFATLFSHGQQLQFILTEERVEVFEQVAFVSLDENLLGDLGDQAAATVAAVNVFVEDDGDWKLVLHHGSAVAST